MKTNRMKDTLENIARRAVPEDVNLMPHIAARLERKSLMTTLRARPVFTILLVLMLLALLTGVVYAIGKATGYIPGIGMIDQSAPLRVLAEPVTVKRDGITITIQQVVADAGRTFVAYGVKGIPSPSDGFPICNAMPFLQLPDGGKLILQGGGGGGMGSEFGMSMRYETEVYYPPIPVEVEHITLTFLCILPEGTGPENWKIPLRLSPAPEGFVTPAVEIGATFVASSPKFAVTPMPTFEAEFTSEAFDPSYPATPTHVPNGSGLYLEKVIELPASYILVGNFTDAGELPGSLETTGSAYDYLPHIEDVMGNPAAFKVRDDIQPDVNWGGVHYWAYEVAKPVQGPLKIAVDQVNISKSNTVKFKFNTGPDPKPGQEWQLDLPIHLGTHDYVVDSVKMIEDGYLFKFHSGIDVSARTSFILDIPGSSLERGPTSGEEDRRSKKVIKYSQDITYLVHPPTGELTVELTLFETVSLQGPWTLIWAPPEVNP